MVLADRRKAPTIKASDQSAAPLDASAGALQSAACPPRFLRPRDAGTLIILDESGGVPKLLMGRRSVRLAFMPGKYVFPGGRLEAGDLALARHFALPDQTRDRLLAATSLRFREQRAIGIALAAIRETFEEVGILVGATGIIPTQSVGFEAFAAAGIVPDPAILSPIARAITPPGHIRRFDTRFFCASSDAIVVSRSFEQRVDDEFDHVDWFSLDRLDTLDLPGITRHVLADIDGRLRDGSWRDTSRTMPFYRARHGRPVREMI